MIKYSYHNTNTIKMDNKISFMAGWFLTTASTISAAGVLNAIILGLLGGFFGLLGKEVYFLAKAQVKEIKPSAKVWINLKKDWIASKIEWIKSKL
jgi:hypothetical protein